MAKTIILGKNDRIGYSNIPNQMMTAMREQLFELNILVAGEHNRKTAGVLNTLFGQEMLAAESTADPDKSGFVSSQVVLEEKGVMLSVSIVEARKEKGKNYTEALSSYIDSRLYQQFINEQKQSRRESKQRDGKIHICLFFVPTNARRLSSAAIKTLREIHDKVPVLPLIGYAETLARGELTRLKRCIYAQLQESQISVFSLERLRHHFGDRAPHIEPFWGALPLAVPSGAKGARASSEYSQKTKAYLWGIMNMESSDITDLLLLRKILVSHYFGCVKKEAELIYLRYRQSITEEPEEEAETEAECLEGKLQRSISSEFDVFCSEAVQLSLEEE